MNKKNENTQRSFQNEEQGLEENPFDSKNSEKEEKNIQEKLSHEVNEDKIKEIWVIVCLAMYSKAVSNKFEFNQKLEKLFKVGEINDDSSKHKLVEWYVVKAVHDCANMISKSIYEDAQKLMVSLYKDEISLEEIRKYLIFDDLLIIKREEKMTESEKLISEEMKKAQKKHGTQNNNLENHNNQSQRALSLTELYGEYLLIIFLGGIICLVVWACTNIVKSNSPEAKIKTSINQLKTERKILIKNEKQ